MPADFSKLIPEFKQKVEQLLVNCKTRNVVMDPYFSIRDPFTQGKLWRQSRSGQEVQQKISELKTSGALFLAHCIESVGPQNGAQVTNAIPGLSWHQWGEAVDCAWLVDGRNEWSTDKKINGSNGYQVYAEEAGKLQLDAGGLWKSFKDWPHVQLRSAGSPLDIFSMQYIDGIMKERFGQS